MESDAGVGSTKRDDDGSENAVEEERYALSTLKDLELNEKEKAHAGSKTTTEKKGLRSPGPGEFPFSFEPMRGLVERGKSKASGGIRKMRKKSYRLGMEYLDYAAEFPLPPLYLPDPRFSDLGTSEPEERFVAMQKAAYEERDNIIRQIMEVGYADVEIEVPDRDEDPL